MSTTLGGAGGSRGGALGALYADAEPLARNWWAIALRGVAAIIFGVLTFFAPVVTVATLVILFGVYSLVDGVLYVVAALRRRGGDSQWGALLLAGIAAIIVGLCTLLLPGMTALFLIYAIAAWAIVTGVSEIVAAVRLRKAIHDEWLLALSGVLSALFGLLLVLAPGLGALTIALWVGAYAFVAGLVLLGLAFRLRGVSATHGGTPSPA